MRTNIVLDDEILKVKDKYLSSLGKLEDFINSTSFKKLAPEFF